MPQDNPPSRLDPWPMDGTWEAEGIAVRRVPLRRPPRRAAIDMIGRFQTLCGIDHEHLCAYFDLQQSSAAGELTLVTEDLGADWVPLAAALAAAAHDVFGPPGPESGRRRRKGRRGPHDSADPLRPLAHALVDALACLAAHNVACSRNVTPTSVLVRRGWPRAPAGAILCDWGWFHLSGAAAADLRDPPPSSELPFLVGAPLAIPPETYALDPEQSLGVGDARADTWALGMLLLEAAAGPLAASSGDDPLDQLDHEVELAMTVDWGSRVAWEPKLQAHPNLRAFIETCLLPVSQRPLPKELLQHPYFSGIETCRVEELRCTRVPALERVWPLCYPEARLQRRQAYLLWRSLYRHQVEHALVAKGLFRVTDAPVSHVPAAVPLADSPRDTEDLEIDQTATIDDPPAILPAFAELKERLSGACSSVEPQILELAAPAAFDSAHINLALEAPESAAAKSQQRRRIRERAQDPVQQAERVALFNQLLSEYPASAETILQAAAAGPVPFAVRGRVWAALLDLRADYAAAYAQARAAAAAASGERSALDVDRQLQVDVPRCHQYNELLASTAGHGALRRVLLAWVASEQAAGSGHVYWQGLDSVAAPLLVLHFGDEALAYACLDAFVKRYGAGLFAADNSASLGKCFAAFGTLLAFHDAELYAYLVGLGLAPELYTVPWLMTKFAHVLHLDRLFQLWDRLLTAPPAYFLTVCVAVLQQQRHELLRRDFNHAMTLFSQLADLDTDLLLADADRLDALTPPSLLAPLLWHWHDHTFSGGSGGPEQARLAAFLARAAVPRPPAAAVGVPQGAPRISAADFWVLHGRALVLDLRPASAFRAGHIIESVRVEPADAVLLVARLNALLAGPRTAFVLVLGDELSAAAFAAILVAYGVSRVAFTPGADALAAAPTGLVHACDWTLDTAVTDDLGNGTVVQRCRGSA